jgi:hypothetical protein
VVVWNFRISNRFNHTSKEAHIMAKRLQRIGVLATALSVVFAGSAHPNTNIEYIPSANVLNVVAGSGSPWQQTYCAWEEAVFVGWQADQYDGVQDEWMSLCVYLVTDVTSFSTQLRLYRNSALYASTSGSHAAGLYVSNPSSGVWDAEGQHTMSSSQTWCSVEYNPSNFPTPNPVNCMQNFSYSNSWNTYDTETL